MNEIQKEIDSAFKLLSALTVRGEAVDVVAACRTALRCAFQAAGEADGGGKEG